MELYPVLNQNLTDKIDIYPVDIAGTVLFWLAMFVVCAKERL